jgi:Mg2+/Co2+ transporter CorC
MSQRLAYAFGCSRAHLDSAHNRAVSEAPVNTAVIVDEYGTVQGIVTRTDLMEAVASHLPDSPEAKVTWREDGSLPIDATTPISDVADLLRVSESQQADFVTVAGLILSNLEITCRRWANNCLGQLALRDRGHGRRPNKGAFSVNEDAKSKA